MFRHLGRFARLAACLFTLAIVMGSCRPPPPIDRTTLLDTYTQGKNTWIKYHLSEAAEVTITIHDSDGNLVRKLELGQKPAGTYQSRERAAHWDGRNTQGKLVPWGTYVCTLTAGEFSVMKELVHEPYMIKAAEEFSEDIRKELEDRRKRKKQESEEKLEKQ